MNWSENNSITFTTFLWSSFYKILYSTRWAYIFSESSDLTIFTAYASGKYSNSDNLSTGKGVAHSVKSIGVARLKHLYTVACYPSPNLPPSTYLSWKEWIFDALNCYYTISAYWWISEIEVSVKWRPNPLERFLKFFDTVEDIFVREIKLGIFFLLSSTCVDI